MPEDQEDAGLEESRANADTAETVKEETATDETTTKTEEAATEQDRAADTADKEDPELVVVRDRVEGSFERLLLDLTRATINEEARTVEISVSSEEPVSRWFGTEILDHDKKSIDLKFFKSGRAPLLLDHRASQQIGVVSEARLDAEARRLRATVRFGKSELASEIFQDVKDGIRQNISVGYQVLRMERDSLDEAGETFRVTKWMPLETSVVAIPADTTVGVGRTATVKPSAPMEEDMPEEQKQAEQDAIRKQAREQAFRDAAEIAALGSRLNRRELAEKAIKDGMTIEQFRGQVLESIKPGEKIGGPTDLGMEEKEQRDYSLLRALRANANKDWSKAGLEREASEEIAKRLGREPNGFFVPNDVLKRELATGTPTAGGNVVGTQHLSGSFIDLLRNRMMVTRLGARMLSGLVGNVDIPKLTGGATAYWVTEGNDTTASDQTFGQVSFAPKTVSAKTQFTRRMMLQSSPDVENLVRDDLSKVLALAIDLAAINGSGAAGQPTGILGTAGIGAVAGGTNGAAPTYQHIVDLETEVAIDNADIGDLAYLTNAKVRGKLKTTEKATGTAQFVWGRGNEAGFGELNGYRAGASNQVPSNLTKGTAVGVASAIIFGNWADLMIGEWGVLDLQADPFTGGDSGATIIRAFQDIDIQVRHAESFAAMQDALTA